MDKETLKDIIINLDNGKYSKNEIINALAWGERNEDIYYPLMKEFQPKYYNDSIFFKDNPVKSCTIIIDLNINYENKKPA